ncbi:MAG: histone deacetylase [Solirubrobacterales bacterium]|nr:histone deacetylase [Solirubrobacterales bacterium]MCB8914990.1 histone deacetylase [Thermoleophilales bacterium]
MKTGLVILREQAGHETGSHPENARRFPGVIDRLGEDSESHGLPVLESRAAEVEDLARAHTESHIANVRAAAENGPTWLDGDTVASPESYNVALRSAGAALVGVDAVSGPAKAADSLFAIIRPPGHHATADRAMGFCLFSNAAVAARYARERLGIDRVAVLDWDVHHGNGTQDILYNDPSVLFISFHQWPLYPGSGWIDEVGVGEGRGFTVNLPMPPGSGDREHIEGFNAVAGPILDQFNPGLLIVSAGQDGHVADQLASQNLTAAGYHALAAASAGFAAGKGIGLLALHEGGYNPNTLPLLDHAVYAGLGGFTPDLAGDSPAPETGDNGWPERLAQIRRAQSAFWAV